MCQKAFKSKLMKTRNDAMQQEQFRQQQKQQSKTAAAQEEDQQPADEDGEVASFPLFCHQPHPFSLNTLL